MKNMHSFIKSKPTRTFALIKRSVDQVDHIFCN